MIKLNDYKNLIDLQPKAKSNVVLSFEEQENIVDKLLEIIKQNFVIKMHIPNDYHGKRDLLWGLLNQIPPYDFGKEFFKLQDELLSSEINKNGIIQLKDLKFEDNIAIFQGDITSLQVDAIVNAGNSQLLGCFVPLHKCIDNIIISRGGFQIRNDLNKMMQKQAHSEPNGNAKITNAYNLPSKFVIHTVGPCICGELTQKDKNELASCYISSINLAKKMNIHSIAFCCLSTGEFHFPNDIACDIAVDTVKNWLQKNNYDIKVVFNVFKDIDRSLYERKLQR